MSFANSWGKALPPTYRNVQASVVDTSYDDEFNKFVAERQTKEAEEAKQEVEAQPTEAVAEEAYQAFVEEAEKPKSKRKKKTEEIK